MKQLAHSICLGLGDLIMWRGYLDPVKHQYDSIKLAPNLDLLKTYRDSRQTDLDFIMEFGKLLFSEPPYSFSLEQHPFRFQLDMVEELKLDPQTPHFPEILCKGEKLPVSEPYLVVNTKVRFLDHRKYINHFQHLGKILTELSGKYLIVVMGERQVERSFEYSLGNNPNEIFSLYPFLMPYLPPERIVDITVPALGITLPNLNKIQQDCMVMRDAVSCINMGVGGSLSLAMASSKVIGFRADQDPMANALFSKEHNNALVTRDWMLFIKRIQQL